LTNPLSDQTFVAWPTVPPRIESPWFVGASEVVTAEAGTARPSACRLAVAGVAELPTVRKTAAKSSHAAAAARQRHRREREPTVMLQL
jgi:hypothetical protein